MRQLLPSPTAAAVDGVAGASGTDELIGELTDDDLLELYRYPEPADGGRVVRANFVSTLDGAATGDDGRSGSINNDADKHVFGLLRALCDVVLVGAGTARAEGYRPIRPREVWQQARADLGLADAPSLAVVSRGLELPEELLDPDGRVLVVTGGTADPRRLAAVRERLGQDAVVAAAGEDGEVDVARALSALSERGLTRVLCEGGPRLMGDVVAAGALDELCLTWSPLLVGGEGPRIAVGRAAQQQLRCAHLLESDGVLLGRWVRG